MPSHNNQRDGMHRQAIHRGRVAYEPNSLAGGYPFQAGAKGFTSFHEVIAADKVRGKAEKFADHFSQATLFWNSRSAFEKAHIVRGYRFELTKVQVPAIRERTVSMLRNVSDELATAVAKGLGIQLPRPMPRLSSLSSGEIDRSPALSLTFRPGDGGIRGQKVAILTAAGVEEDSVVSTGAALIKAGAVVRLVAATLAAVVTTTGKDLEPDATFETMPSVLFDAVVVPDGDQSVSELASLGQALEFLKDQYRHCKPILWLGAGQLLLEEAGIPIGDSSDWAMDRNVRALRAIAKHRNWDRATDPPAV